METNNHQWSEATAHLNAQKLSPWFTPGFEALFKSLITQTQAHEGSLWIHEANSNELVVAYNSGPKSNELQNALRIPADKGLVGKCFSENKPFHHQGLFRHKSASHTVDKELIQKTHDQATVPFYLNSKLVGAITIVQLSDDKQRNQVNWGFNNDTLEFLESFQTPLAELLELGWHKASPPKLS